MHNWKFMNMRGAFNDGVSSELERNLPPNGAQIIDWTLRQGVGGEMRSIPVVPCVLLAATYQSQFFFNIKKDDSARHHTHTHSSCFHLDVALWRPPISSETGAVLWRARHHSVRRTDLGEGRIRSTACGVCSPGRNQVKPLGRRCIR